MTIEHHEVLPVTWLSTAPPTPHRAFVETAATLPLAEIAFMTLRSRPQLLGLVFEYCPIEFTNVYPSDNPFGIDKKRGGQSYAA
jgi:hypothetical protein